MDNSDIEYVAAIFNQNQINYWFVGGRAIDLLLGYESRPHKDLDFLVSIADFETCRRALLDDEFTILPQTDREEGVFLQKGELLVDLTKVQLAEVQQMHTFGVYEAVSWPVGLLEPHSVQLGQQAVTTLYPENHVAMKTAVAEWYTNGQLRPEDENDILNLKNTGLIH